MYDTKENNDHGVIRRVFSIEAYSLKIYSNCSVLPPTIPVPHPARLTAPPAPLIGRIVGGILPQPHFPIVNILPITNAQFSMPPAIWFIASELLCTLVDSHSGFE
jgi:hypothetical protein